MKKTLLLFVAVLTLFLSACASNFHTADINLHGVKLKNIKAHHAAAYYLAEDGTLYSTGADSDASSYVAYQDKEQGIVAYDVTDFHEIVIGGCYINSNNELYMWREKPNALYNYSNAHEHSCIMTGVKSVLPLKYSLLYTDLEDNLFLIGKYKENSYSMKNPLLLASGTLSVGAYGEKILWVNHTGTFDGSGFDDDFIADLNERFAGTSVTSIQVQNDFLLFLVDGQLWFFGDYSKLTNRNNTGKRQFVLLDQDITEISCSYRTAATLDGQGCMKVWGRCISNDERHTDSPQYEYCDKKIVAENATSIFVSDSCICYIDAEGASYIYHSGGWTSFYGNATKDKYVGLNRTPNTWTEK